MKSHGFTVRSNWGSDRPDYEADIKGCAHCRRTFFLCDSITKKPLPADALMERCGCCDSHICRKCKWMLNSGAAVCSPFVSKIDALEEAYAQYKRIGTWT